MASTHERSAEKPLAEQVADKIKEARDFFTPVMDRIAKEHQRKHSEAIELDEGLKGFVADNFSLGLGILDVQLPDDVLKKENAFREKRLQSKLLSLVLDEYEAAAKAEIMELLQGRTISASSSESFIKIVPGGRSHYPGHPKEGSGEFIGVGVFGGVIYIDSGDDGKWGVRLFNDRSGELVTALEII